MHVRKKLCSLATVSNCSKFTTVLLSSHSPRPISSDLLKLSPKCSTERKIIDGSKSLQLLQPHLLHRIHQPPTCLWKDSICPLEMKHPASSAHPPQSYFSSALMSLPPASSSSRVYTHISHILLVHSSERMLQVRVFSSATGADLMAAGVLSDQSQDKGLSKALTLKEMRIPVFNRVPWLQNLSLFTMLGRSGWATCFRKTVKSFPVFSSTCIASPCGCSSCFSQSGESLRTLPEKSHSLASTFSIANLSFSFHKISYCSHAHSWFPCYLFYR